MSAAVSMLVAVLATACGGAGAIPSSSLVAALPGPAVPAAAQTGEDPSDGSFVVSYEAADTQQAIDGKQLAQDTKLLEEMGTAGDALFKLPYDVDLIGRQCNIENAYYDPSTKSVVICYEDVKAIFDIATAQAGGDQEMLGRRFASAEFMTFFHELGHMAIDIYALPATGREEDSADQLATLVLVSADGQYVVDAADYWFSLAGGQYDTSAFADEHSLSEQRGFNLLCWAYGSDPQAYAALVAPAGDLPAERAERCPDEFTKLAAAWEQLLAPYVEDAMVT